MGPTAWAVIAVGGLIVLLLMATLGQFISLYLQAWLSNAQVGMIELVGMHLRRVDARTVVINRIRAAKSGLAITTNQLETHYLSGGHVPDVVSAMIVAKSAGRDLPWEVAAEMDLTGRDVLREAREHRGPTRRG